MTKKFQTRNSTLKKKRKSFYVLIPVPHSLHKTGTRKLRLSPKEGLSSSAMPAHKPWTGSRFSNDELHDELAFRLSDCKFAMSSRHAVPLVRCFERKDIYKAWGATYNPDAKQWYFPPGTNLRELLRQLPGWLQKPELLRREIA